MKKLKYFILSTIILGTLFFLFGPKVLPENFQFQELVNSSSQTDVVIIFNSGGWGNTPIDQAEDFEPIIKGIQNTLSNWGYNSIVIPYIRTKDDLLGKITGAKEIFNSFQNSSVDLADKIEIINEKLPDKKIIIAGLSNGASFVTETYEKVSEEVKDSVYTIAVGSPFWTETFQSVNILQLNNNGKDSLVEGNAKDLLLTFFRTPFKWLFSRISGQNYTFSQVFNIPGHNYSWGSPEVSSQIVTFLEKRFR